MNLPLNGRKSFLRHGMRAALLIATIGIDYGALMAQDASMIPYGNHVACGQWVSLNGIKMYYEVYGKGQPLLLIHGNGGSIASMKNQIPFFSSRYCVIAVDSRGHGKSELGAIPLTYEQMGEDYHGLLTHLKVSQANVLGWSDGGIIGLLLAIKHPDKVGKLAIMGANLNPQGAYSWALDYVNKEIQKAEAMMAKKDNSNNWLLTRELLHLLGKQPNIAKGDLHKINAPTLVMAGDKDVIKTEHTIEIFDNLSKAHLCIFPGATHMMPKEGAKLFNETVLLFFETPFVRPDTKELFKEWFNS